MPDLSLQISIDGRDAQSQAPALRAQLEQALTLEIPLAFDEAAIQALIQRLDQLNIGGAVKIKGLDQAIAQVEALRAAGSGPLTIAGKVEVEGLAETVRQITAMRSAAGKVGSALTEGLVGQWGQVESLLTDFQRRLTGLVRPGSGNIADDIIADLPGLNIALDEAGKKTLKLTEQARALQGELDAINARMGQLGTTPVNPMGGGPTSGLSELFKGLDEAGTKGAVTRRLKEVDSELNKMTVDIGGKTVNLIQEIKRRQAAEMQAAKAAVDALLPQIEAVNQQMEAALAARPAGSVQRPETWSEERRQWEAEYQGLLAEQDRLNQQLNQARSLRMTGDNEHLIEMLERRRNELEGPLRDELKFWQEWSSKSVTEVANALRGSGQSAAATALEQMQSLAERRRDLIRKMETTRAGLQQGATTELPKGAEGTLVDLVAGERALAEAAAPATIALSEQQKVLIKLVAALDAARLSADGMGKAEREAVSRLEAVAQREIKGTVKTGAPLEEGGAAAREILGRLAQEVEATRQAMERSLDQPVIEGATQQATGLLKIWETVRDKLVGHSVVPDMVRDVNEWLARMGATGLDYNELIADSEQAADRVVAAFQEAAAGLPVDAIDARIGELEADISGLGSEMEGMMTRGTAASARYQAMFEQAVEDARRLRGVNPADEAMYAQGYLPTGFGVGQESKFYKPGAMRGSNISESDDSWHKVLSTDIQQKQRYSADELKKLDELSSQISAKQSQIALLLSQRMEGLTKAFDAAVLQNDETAMEQLWGQMEDLQMRLQDAGADMESFQLRAAAEAPDLAPEAAAPAEPADASVDVTAQARAQAAEAGQIARAEAEERIQEARRATAVVTEGMRQETAEARAQAAERSQAARAGAEAQIQAERRATAEVTAQAKAQGVQKEQAARRTTLKLQADRTAALEAEKRATAETKAGAAVMVEAAKQQTEEAKQEVVAKKAAAAEQTRLNKLTAEARVLAGSLGKDWGEVEADMQASGKTIDTVVGELRRAQAEQRRLTQNAKETEDKYKGSFGWARRFADELNKTRMNSMGIMQIFGDLEQIAMPVGFAGTAVTGGLTMAGKSYVEYAKEVEGAGRSLLLTREQTRLLGQEIIKTAGATGLLEPDQLAAGTAEWARATGQVVEGQEDIARIMKETLPMQRLSVLANENITDITEGTAAAISQFGLTMDDVEEITAKFYITSQNSIASVGSLAEGLKYVGPQARQMGDSLSDAFAVLGTLASKGVQGSMAGTGYRTMLVQMVDQSKEAKAALAEIFGPDQNPFFDAQGQFIGTAAAIDKLAAATENMSEQEKSEFLNKIFETRALTTVTSLIEAQTEGRKRGINVLRAQADLIDGVTNSETEAYAAMQKELTGATIAQMGAIDLWNKTIDSWNESDVQRVAQAEMRWKGFWLTIGADALDVAMPAIETAIGMLENMTDLVRDNPIAKFAIGTLGVLGAGGIGLVGLASGISSLGRVVAGTWSTLAAWKAASAGEAAAKNAQAGQIVTAGQQFQATVVAAAEQAAAALQGGATTAAATEEGGAVAESATEVAGGEAETAIEVAGATTETAIENGGAAGKAALGAAGAAAPAVAGGAIATGGTVLTAAGGVSLSSLLAAISAPVVAGGLALGGAGYEGLRGLGVIDGPGLDKFASVAAYKIGSLFSEQTGQDWFTAVAQATGAMKDFSRATDGMSQSAQDAWAARYAGLAGQYASGGGGLEGVAQINKGAAGGVSQDDLDKAIEIYEAYLKRHTEIIKDAADDIADAGRDLQKDLGKLEKDYYKNRDKTAQDFYDDEQKRDDEVRRRQEEALREHQLKMQRMEEDHYLALWEFSISRDALSMFKENQKYDLEKKRAEEDFANKQATDTENAARERAERQAQFEQRMADMQVEYEEERANRLQEYAERVAEIQRQRDEELAALDQENYEKIKKIMGYNAEEQALLDAHRTAMLADMSLWLDHNRQLWLNYVSSLPTPQWAAGGGSSPADYYPQPAAPAHGGAAYALGGYVTATEPALVHQGEFVINARTAAQIEANMGPITQGRLAGMSAGGGDVVVQVPIDAKFVGVADADRDWIDQKLDEFAGQVTDQVLGQVARIIR